MYGEYFQHLLKTEVHKHFPNFERTNRITIEDESSFTTVIREFRPDVRIDRSQVLEMRHNFLSYLKRRSGSLKLNIEPCSGTIGRWSRKRSACPIMELSYACYDTFYYKNWIDSNTLDRITWSNIIPIIVTRSFCPYGTKEGIIFIID